MWWKVRERKVINEPKEYLLHSQNLKNLDILYKNIQCYPPCSGIIKLLFIDYIEIWIYVMKSCAREKLSMNTNTRALVYLLHSQDLKRPLYIDILYKYIHHVLVFHFYSLVFIGDEWMKALSDISVFMFNLSHYSISLIIF